MIRITDIIDNILTYNPGADIDLVNKAYVYSARVHDGQVRLSGEPYLSHPLEVAGILSEMKLDVQSIAAGLLHDVVEDTHATEEEVYDMFGPHIGHIVAGVTKLSSLPFHSSQERHAENIRKMILAMADDIRVIFIKLADRIHNMRTLQYHQSEKKKKEIAQETIDIYASIASRLGIYWIRKELEDNSFKYLFPDEYENIKKNVTADKEQRESYVEYVKELIRKEMEKNGLNCEVLGRYKHFYSIYQKMKQQDLDFKDVYDIIAFRIILKNQSECYNALGLLHNLWKPIDKKFKDYIARPKSNMYQSLHTTLIGPEGDRIEVQIRTREMNRVARSGIAAHWSYKEGARIDEKISQRFAWLQNLVENQEHIKDPKEFMDNVRIDLFPDDVYVYTPTGEVKTLVKGATAIDFAYQIHTEVGNECVGAKVNGRMAPLKYVLKTGDVVEILTQKGQKPSKDWLAFVKTGKARSRIRQWIKNEEKERSLSLGRELVEKTFRKHRLNFSEAVKTEEMEKVVEQFGFRKTEDLIAHVGYGKITPLQVVRKYTSLQEPSEENIDQLILEKTANRPTQKPKGGIVVQGLDDILIRFGKCCQPVPGDPIIGFITRGQGVTVHHTNCVNVLKMSSERLIDVEWSDKSFHEFPARIRIISRDRVGLLADIASNISKNGANIMKVNSIVQDNSTVKTILSLTVKDVNHLNQVLTDIRKVKHIIEVRRLQG